MKSSVKSSMVVLALGLGLSIGTSEDAEAVYESPYGYFNDIGIRDSLFYGVDNVYFNQYQAEIDKLNEKYDSGAITNDEYNRRIDELQTVKEKDSLDREKLFNSYGLLKKQGLKNLTHFDTDFEEYSSLSGFEQMTELEQIQGEGGNFNSFRELANLKKLKTILLEANNQLTLNSFKNLEDLESIRLHFDGFENNDEHITQQYTQVLTTDISALSDLDKLKEIKIDARGRMATITLKKGTTSYQLFDPVVPSKQFTGAKMSYFSDKESDEWLEWNDLKGNEKYLEFSWRIEKGRNISYTGEGQIPIRWK